MDGWMVGGDNAVVVVVVHIKSGCPDFTLCCAPVQYLGAPELRRCPQLTGSRMGPDIRRLSL